MPASLWTASGIIENIGTTVAQDGRLIHSGVRLRREDGTAQVIPFLMVSRLTDLLVNPRAEVRLAGFYLEDRHVLVAVAEDGDTLDDIDGLLVAQDTMRRTARFLLVAAAVLSWTVIVPALLINTAIRVLRNVREMASLEEMEAMVARLEKCGSVDI